MRQLHQRLALSGVVLLAACGGVSRDEIHASLAGTLSDSTPPEYAAGAPWKLVREVYADADGHALWVDDGAPHRRARELVEAVAGAEEQGLRAAEYDLAGLAESLRRTYKDGETTAAELAELDVRFTALYLDFGRHLLSGRIDPSRVSNDWFIRTRRASVDSALREAASAGNIGEALQRFAPSFPDYQVLTEARNRYAVLAEQGGFPRVEGPIRPGATGKPVEALVARLVAEGDLDSARATAAYDSTVARAVAAFRTRYGLPESGGVDRAMVAAMNVSAERRMRQIELNLERLRWLPNELGARHVMVNIPDFQLHAFDGGKEVLTMRVIVGDEYDGSTPVFADTMNQVVFRPYWNVPAGIATNEILPLVQDDEAYLARNQYEVVPRNGGDPLDPRSVDWDDLDSTNFPYLIRQKPGPTNALGLVKFLFPNRFDIYMHDTPGDHLFQRQKRALSHGCIRLEHPDRFASYALDGSGNWDAGRIREAMNAETPQEVRLERPVPVFILYLTAFARDGRVHFRPDLYDIDTRGIERLGRAPPLEQIAALRATFDELMKG